ncbi:hypothetical protein QYE76_014582 [Lolium multiflorum]|uniref:ABC transporter domain-containing protein n=1 Tax=Lolium multiflorum TaxID=4521 RepID=A0AAD8U0Y4_LOLMU|nr:hypothetical protein QYE76_014582 [Lolium multiflorum]
MPSKASEIRQQQKKANQQSKHGGVVEKKSVSATPTSQGVAAAAEMNEPTEKEPILTAGDDYFKVENLSLKVDGHDIIVDSSIELHKGSRYALVGPNGSGKSTLLAAVGSSIPVPEFMTVYRLADGFEKSDLTVLDAVMGDDHLEEKNRLDQLIANSDLEQDKEEFLKELDDIGPKARHRACEILVGFGFTSYMLHSKTREFSDGWRMRMALARALYVKADILLLDNPTNHLDFDACAFLEESLSDLTSIILLVISNCQSFLTKVCNRVLEIDMHKTLVEHYTRYNEYLESREKEREGQDEVVGTKTTCDPGFKFTAIARVVPKGQPAVVQCLNASFSYKDNVVFKCLNLGIDFDSKIALVGPNGSGKSTLLKLLAGQLSPSQGKVSAQGTKVLYFDQGSIATLDEEKSGIQFLRAFSGNNSIAILTAAACNFGLSEEVLKRQIKILSQGQRTRLILSGMTVQKPHVLLLDEPTDHLDFHAVGLLAEGLSKWNGAVVIAGHDSRLISLVAQQIWLCEKKLVTKQPVVDMVTKQQVFDIAAHRLEMIKKAADARYLVRLPATTELFGLFSVGNYHDVAIPCVSYMKYVDCQNKCYREPAIPVDRFRKRRHMTAYAPSSSLEGGFLQLPGEIVHRRYKIATDVSRKISSSLLLTLWTLDKVCGLCVSDIKKENILVTPSGEIKFKGTEFVKRTDDLVSRNISSAQTILEDLFSSGGEKPPPEIDHLLDMMKNRPEKRELFHTHTSLIPLCSQSDCYMKLHGCLNNTIEPMLRDKIYEDLPHTDTFEADVQTNLLLKAHFDKGDYKTLLPTVQQGQTLTDGQLKWYKREQGKKLCLYLRNRASHKMDLFRSVCRYLADMADLASHVRFPLVNCYLQEKLFDAGAARDLMLHKLIQ